jgi:hypothetical protein
MSLRITNSSTGLRNVCTFPAKTRSKVANITSRGELGVMHQRKDMDLEYKKASQKYSISHMNNSKWLKLFSAWADSGVEIDISYWKFIDSEHQETHGLPKHNDLLQNRFAEVHFNHLSISGYYQYQYLVHTSQF